MLIEKYLLTEDDPSTDPKIEVAAGSPVDLPKSTGAHADDKTILNSINLILSSLTKTSDDAKKDALIKLCNNILIIINKFKQPLEKLPKIAGNSISSILGTFAMDLSEAKENLDKTIKAAAKAKTSTASRAAAVETSKKALEEIFINFYNTNYKNINDIIDDTIDNLSGSTSNTTKQEWQKKLGDLASGKVKEIEIQDPKDPTKTITCTTVNELLNVYYKTDLATELGIPGDKTIEICNNLGEAFVNELLKLGFTPITNPFLAFIKEYQNKNSSIEDAWKNLTSINYNGIHNMYVTRRLTDKDLRGTGILQLENLIFNPNLYTVNAGEVPKYLNIQYEIIISIQKNTEETKNLLAKNNNKIIDFTEALLYEGGNPISGKAPSVDKILKNITAINNLYTECFDESLNISNKLPFNINMIKSDITDASKAKKIMCYLIISVLGDSVELRPTLAKFNLKDSDGPNFREMIELSNIFNSVELKPANLNYVLQQIAKIGKVAIPEEAKA